MHIDSPFEAASTKAASEILGHGNDNKALIAGVN